MQHRYLSIEVVITTENNGILNAMLKYMCDILFVYILLMLYTFSVQC